MSRKYMPLYVAEFQFRYKNRNNSNIFSAAASGVSDRHSIPYVPSIGTS
jgi:hypothetical protein